MTELVVTKRIAVITAVESDFLSLLESSGVEVTRVHPSDVANTDLDQFHSIAVLGGGEDSRPLLLAPRDRIALEKQIAKGKKVFAEYIASIGHVYFEPEVNTRYDRLAYVSSGNAISGLEPGTLIDDQCGLRLPPHSIAVTGKEPILQYIKMHAHDRIKLEKVDTTNINNWALWFEEPNNLLVCSFRFSCFRQARFAPWTDIKKLTAFILHWLLDEHLSLDHLEASYKTGGMVKSTPLKEQIERSAFMALDWFEDAGILLEDGKQGALEGLGTEIYPDGSQRVSRILRADCIGETALPYFLDYLLRGKERSLQISEHLSDFVFDNYMCRDEGDFYGMFRWTNEAWGVCYADDVARAILPQLLKCLYLGNDHRLDDCVSALRFLVNTTGTDGTRISRTDKINLTQEKLRELKETPGKFPSAHYNAYYYATLLLTYKLTGIEQFKQTAIQGLTTIMSVYPETTREQSETQEYCRLILPLSWLYWVTNEQKHKEWLYQVTDDLAKFKHVSGGYLEWDSGYTASMRNEIGEGESSLIAKNGDPVVDLLYSNNWLPIGFIQAYWITGDDKFKQLWNEIAGFMVNTQIHSENKDIHGAWARAYDVERGEVFGSPADLGWGPWSIESGWTVAEISSGLYMGLFDDLAKHYEDKY